MRGIMMYKQFGTYKLRIRRREAETIYESGHFSRR